MFVTSPQMRHQLASALFPGHDVWDLVEIPLATPLVISRIRVGRSRRNQDSRTYFSKTDRLAALALDPDVRILGADALLPPQVAKSKQWELHRVQELWQCEEPEVPGVLSWVLSTADGEHADSVCGTAAGALKNRRLLYRLKAVTTAQKRPRQ